MFSEELLNKISQIPTSPGIYQFKNENGKIIYIGKAKNLRNRVKSYLNNSHANNAKTQALVQKITDVEVIIVDSEAEALMLEDTLIKKHKPRYNILLRDDKTYPYIRITNETFPRIFITRTIIKDGSKYLGPFTDVRSVKYLLTTVRSIFQIRSCKKEIKTVINDKWLMVNDGKGEQTSPLQTDVTVGAGSACPTTNINHLSLTTNHYTRACLDFHIGKCQAPCISGISKDEYKNNVKMANQVLLGKTKQLAKDLEELMQKYSDEMEFEKAATVRNRLRSLGDFIAKQKVISPEFKDRDIFGIARNGEFACTLVFIVREGKLIGKRHFLISKASLESDEEILQRTVEKYYLESDFIPKEIILPNEIADLEYFLDFLSVHRHCEQSVAIHSNKVDCHAEAARNDGKTISVLLPKIGDKHKFVEMANTNAEFLLKEFISSFEKRDKIIPHSLLSLQRDLNLKNPPRRIECFDNSHIQGSDMVSAMIVFIDGKPKKSEYRKYKKMVNDKWLMVNDTEGQPQGIAPTNDDANLRGNPCGCPDENINHSSLTTNHLNDDFAMMRETIERRFLRAIEEKQELPDLVIVDGGKGQLSSAFGILEKLGLSEKVAIIGLAKRLEEVFKPNSSLPIMLPKTSSSLKLLQQLRDEAHRFAITFHRQLRDKRAIQSELSEIKGIGKITMKKLIDKFGSVKGVKEASDSELLEVLNMKQFESLQNFLLQKP